MPKRRLAAATPRIIGINPNGHLMTTEWAEGSGNQIGTGWNTFSHVLFSDLAYPGFPSQSGLYGIKPTGELFFYHDTNNNGIFEPQSGEMGIDGVRLDLYIDANNDGQITPDEIQAYAGHKKPDGQGHSRRGTHSGGQ